MLVGLKIDRGVVVANEGYRRSVSLLFDALWFVRERIGLFFCGETGRLPHSNRLLPRRFSLLPPPLVCAQKIAFLQQSRPSKLFQA